jgi:hypothetical protein
VRSATPANADLLRSLLLMGNGVMMRSETNNAKQVFKVAVNARDFPDMPGYAYLARPTPGDRQAPYRAYHVNDVAIDRWSDSFEWRQLNRLQEAAVAEDAGSWYADRHKLAAARRSEASARLARLRSGAVRTKQARETEKVAEATGVRVTPGVSFGDGMPGCDDVTRFWATAAPAAVHEPSAAERSLTESQRRVVDAIGRGASTPAQIGEEVGLGKTRVAELLKELVRMEVIHQPTGYGTYATRRAGSTAGRKNGS